MGTVRFSPGDVLRGKYKIKRLLGEGGMGVVVRATHLRLDQDVAIKMLREDGAAKAHVVERFAREARAAARLRGEHAVRILDVDDEGGAPFLVMEHLEGSDLDRLVRRDGPLAMKRAVDYVLQACAGLAEAHALGIVHRDVKPANIFLAKTPRGGEIVKILDFGISKALDERDPTITDGERMLGSPAFMSPEQLKAARDVDARTDVWALGVVLHFLLTSELPFDGDSATAVAARIASEPPISLAELRPDVPAELGAVVGRCLSKERDGRFASVAELALALAPFADAGASAAQRVASVLRMRVANAAPSTPSATSSVSRAAGPATASLDAFARGTEPAADKLTASLDAPGPVSLGILPVGATGDGDAGEGEREEREEGEAAPTRGRASQTTARSRRWSVTAAVLAVAAGVTWVATHQGRDVGGGGGSIGERDARGAANANANANADADADAEVNARANADGGATASARGDAGRDAAAAKDVKAAGATTAFAADAAVVTAARRGAVRSDAAAPADNPLELDIK